MLLIVFCCGSAGFVMYLVMKRINRSAVEHAVHAAVHEVKKELQERHSAMVAQLATKERELSKARDLVALHQAVPSSPSPPKAGPGAAAKSRAAEVVERPEPLAVFQMSRPFTDTSYDALLANSDVVKVEPAAMK